MGGLEGLFTLDGSRLSLLELLSMVTFQKHLDLRFLQPVAPTDGYRK